MRIVFKTRYSQDLTLWRHGGDLFWYALLLVTALLIPLAISDYYVGELNFLLIWAVGGLGTMVLVGHSGQVSLGQAAFIGIGAYIEAIMLKAGVPFPLSLSIAAGVSALVGVLIGVPLTRLHGIYLAIGTLAFASIMEQVFAHSDTLTGGLRGMAVPVPSLFGQPIDTETRFYFVCLPLVVICTLGLLNWLRSPTGRALIAIRDSEVAARSMGINLVFYKTAAFGASAFLSGLMGALFAHKITYLSPETFNALLSIQMLMLVVVGGLGSIHGVFFGAVFIVIVPIVIGALKNLLPATISQQPAIEPGLYGVLLVLFIIFEPGGLYARWQKIKYFFSVFPLYKAAAFKKQKTYMRSERLR